MNIWFGIVTLVFIFVTTGVIYAKHRQIKMIIWNIVRFMLAGVALYFGSGTTEIWKIIVCGMMIGFCFLISAMHAYNKLFAPRTYESVGETRKPRSFGNDYWE